MSATAKKTIFFIVLASLAILAGASVFYRSMDILPFLLGLSITTSFNIIFKVIIFGHLLDKAFDSENPNPNSIRLHFMLGFLLSAGLLIAAALLPFINLWGAIAGIVTMQIAIILLKFFPASDFEVDMTKVIEYNIQDESEADSGSEY